MTSPRIRTLAILFAILVPALLPAQRLWVGMPVTSIPGDSQLSRGMPPDFVFDGLYLVEFNDTRFADPSTESGRLNLELYLKQWDAFRASPPLSSTRLTFLQFEGQAPVLHKVELFAWDGKMAIDGSAPRPFQLTTDPEVRHHNTFIYLKTARQAQAAGELERAKAHLDRIFILDPNSSEAPQARDLLIRIEAEERRKALDALMARADAARSAGRLDEAVALYGEALQRFGPDAGVTEALNSTKAELQVRLKAVEEAKRQLEEERRNAEEQTRRAREQARVEIEAQRQAEVQAEAATKDQQVAVLLSQARTLREQGKFQEAAETLQAASWLDPDNPQAKAEAHQLRIAAAGQKLQGARTAAKAGRKGEALRLLNDAKEWDPANTVIDLELEMLRKSIAPGEVDSMEMAEVVWAPSRDTRFVIMPPASPESEAGKIFLWGGVLEREIDGRYLVKVGREYQFCFTADFPLKGINYNAGIRVMGEYTGNVTFTTVLDVPVQVPCLKAFYVE